MKSLEYLPENCPPKYFSEQILAYLCKYYGTRGDILCDIHRYLRFVDDQTDNIGSLNTKTNKLDFIERQIELNRNGNGEVHPEETRYSQLSWSVLGDKEDQVRSFVHIILNTIKEDIVHQPFIPRTAREIRHYNIRMLNSVFGIVNIVLNKRDDVKITGKFADLLDNWNNSGSLRDMREDIGNEMLQVPFTKDEVAFISESEKPFVRKGRALNIYDPKRYKIEKIKALKNILKNSRSIFDLDIPSWQKIGAYFYITLRIPFKIAKKIKYPSTELN